MSKSLRISRRTLLKGVGAAVALPWLEIMSRTTALGGTVGQPPVRMGFFYVPNGIHMANWKPAEAGALGELPPILKGLEPVKQKTLVLSNLAADHCNGNGAAHEPSGGGFLVGKKCKHSEVPEVGGVSVDQVAAQEIGLRTPVDSLSLGIDPGHRGDHGYSGTYMSHISWRSKTTPTSLELNPKQLYDRLFRGKALRRPDWNAQNEIAAAPSNSVEASVLDLVQEETRSLQRQLGYSDRRKLEEYLDGLRNIERRIDQASADSHSHHQDDFKKDPLADADEPDLPSLIIPDGKGIPSVYSDHVNLMLDIMTLAFQTDTTRVGTFMFSYEKSGRAYPQIEAPGSHHSTSHHGGKAENHDQLRRINAHHVELFARMLQRMSQIEEGAGTLLDNVLLCYGSGISDGNKHNHDDLPIILAGGAGGKIQGGRHIVYPAKTPICNLYVDMLNRCGVQRDRFGDSTGRLGELAGS
ncbi:DUF1552 domain-containing protein [Planctomicrobium piriforme]|uniref:Tat (Twin-arginine translocation) pathway signal sequence n=1 Tax=Planctomicrobium piriforme TaxID=1576369 RepID=A0A1I3M7J3_9PLAN|nr:DUF1552 domain-containing protein [Planctomicrobium piriforme]SFI92907.1 Protein of unknown function [Planctomicrobium piriforme]